MSVPSSYEKSITWVFMEPSTEIEDPSPAHLALDGQRPTFTRFCICQEMVFVTRGFCGEAAMKLWEHLTSH